MGEIIKNKVYFYLTKSVFSEASKNLSNPSFKFLQNSVLIKLFHRKKMNPHIVFYPQDGVEELKTEFGNKFEALVQIGENMFCPEFNPQIKGNINQRVLSYSTDMNGDISFEDKVKIICSDKLIFQFFETEIKIHKYPVECIWIDDALDELNRIKSEFDNNKTYVDDEILN